MLAGKALQPLLAHVPSNPAALPAPLPTHTNTQVVPAARDAPGGCRLCGRHGNLYTTAACQHKSAAAAWQLAGVMRYCKAFVRAQLPDGAVA